MLVSARGLFGEEAANFGEGLGEYFAGEPEDELAFFELSHREEAECVVIPFAHPDKLRNVYISRLVLVFVPWLVIVEAILSVLSVLFALVVPLLRGSVLLRFLFQVIAL